MLIWLSTHSFGDCKSEIILMLLRRHRMFLRFECWSLADAGLTKHLLFQRDDSLGTFGIFAVCNDLAQDARCGRGFWQVIAGNLRQSFDSVLTPHA
jgi:hypothetical protein